MSRTHAAPVPPAVPDATGFQDPAARNYLFVGLASLLVVAAAMLARPGGSLLAALLPALAGALGLFARWSPMPAFTVLLLAYFLVFPFGVWEWSGIDEPVRLTHFRIMDLVLVGGVVTYLAAQYRLMSLTDRAVPPDSPGDSRPSSEPPLPRPGSNVAAGEFGRLFAVLAACVVGGQLVWILVTEFKVDYRAFPPIAVNEDAGSVARWEGRFVPRDSSSRFLLFTGLAAAAGVSAGLVLWYWGVARMSPERARMFLLDVLWREHRRELNRQEKWRAWGLARGRPAVERPRAPWTWGDVRRTVLRVALLAGVILLFWTVAFCVLANTL